MKINLKNFVQNPENTVGVYVIKPSDSKCNDEIIVVMRNKDNDSTVKLVEIDKTNILVNDENVFVLNGSGYSQYSRDYHNRILRFINHNSILYDPNIKYYISDIDKQSVLFYVNTYFIIALAPRVDSFGGNKELDKLK